MDNKDSQQTNTKASMGSLIVEGGFEDQVMSVSVHFINYASCKIWC